MGRKFAIFEQFRHRKIVILALILPAIPYALLAWIMPPQYHFVVGDAFQRGTPLLFAIAAMLAYLALLLWMLVADNALNRTFAVLATLPFIAALASFLLATGPTIYLGLIAVLTVLIGAGLVLLSRKSNLTMPAKVKSVWIVLACGIVLFLGSGIASLLDPLAFPRTIGSLAILAISLGTLALLACAMALKPKFGAGFIAFCVVAAILFDSNNHRIPSAKAKSSPQDLDASFATWLSSRRDLDAYRSRKKPYPVIFVSSEGGGIYAAAHAYGTLSTIARNCPTFSQHVFATVGVSGGAIGNALFAAAIDPEQKPYAPCSANGRAVDPKPIVTDHLSPVLARLLFVETVDRLLPGQWVSRDRAQVLSDSFLSVTADKAYAAAALTDSFDPAGARPALISVTTDRDTGNRVILSPFRPTRATVAEWWPGSSPFAEEAGPRDERIQISAINAAGLSARFPWVTPTGHLTVSAREDRVLADGGYFDNSGAETIMDLIDALKFDQNWDRFWSRIDLSQDPADRTIEPDCRKLNVRLLKNFHGGDDEDGNTEWKECEIPIFPIYFALASSEPIIEEDPAKPLPKNKVRQSFAGDPLTVLLQTRRSRGLNALDYADLYYCGLGPFGGSGAECAAEPGSGIGMFRNDIHPEAWRLPLGWFISRDSFRTIIGGTADPRYFDYRKLRQPAESQTELMIYHLDPALYDEGSSPSLDDLYANFGP